MYFDQYYSMKRLWRDWCTWIGTPVGTPAGVPTVRDEGVLDIHIVHRVDVHGVDVRGAEEFISVSMHK